MAPREVLITKASRKTYELREALFSEQDIPKLYQQAQQTAYRMNLHIKNPKDRISPGKLFSLGVLRLVQKEVISYYTTQVDETVFDRIGTRVEEEGVVFDLFTEALYGLYPSMIGPAPQKRVTLDPSERKANDLQELLLLEVTRENPAIMRTAAGSLFDPDPKEPHVEVIEQTASILKRSFSQSEEGGIGESRIDLYTFLTEPARRSPDDLSAQLSYIMKNWKGYFVTGANLLLRSLDFIREEERPVFPPGPGPVETVGYDAIAHEYEAFSTDSDWMPNVVMLAKSTLVWLDQLTKLYGYPITRLDQIPDRELDLMAERGFTALWLIGLWERCPASKKIKQMCGNADAEASAYALTGYDIAYGLGGWDALYNLRDRCRARGIRLASDMVPNHTGLTSDWMVSRPDLFLQLNESPYPSYTFNGPDLSEHHDVGIYLEDHYYDKTDAAVTFKRVDRRTGDVAYIYHGNDGTTMPWNDTAQLNYLNPETREIVIQTILHVARTFPIIRFDAAMTLARKHIQRLWFPKPGTGGDIPGRSAYGLTQEEFDRLLPQEFWREVVDRVAEEVPDTLLLAEAFWMMEGYFVRTLGMHRVYNSAFMHMLKNQDNRKHRDTIKNTIAFDPEILKRFVNFMNNPDEETAAVQFGDGDKYFGVCTLLVTMPGLPMIGHGQVEGFREKYGMEFSKSYWNETPDPVLIGNHYRKIFPLMRRRHLFSGAEQFNIYDLNTEHGTNENVYAYSNACRNERSLVFFNNDYASTAGWIHMSAPSLIRVHDDERRLTMTSIGEALGLTDAPNAFCICRNFNDGLMYIRPSQEILERGLFVLLKGYETQVFIDFTELYDSDGTYARLCEHLNGEGISDIHRAALRIRILPIHQSADPLRSPQARTSMRRLLDGIPGATEEFLNVFAPVFSDVTVSWAGVHFDAASRLPRQLSIDAEEIFIDSVMALGDLFLQTAKDPEIDDSSSPGIRYIRNSLSIMPEISSLLCIWALCKPASVLFTPADSPDFARELLLDEYLRDTLREVTVPAEEATRIARAVTLLFHYAGWYSDLSRRGLSSDDMLRTLFSDGPFREFVQCNWHEGIEWYRKESFQEAVFWLYLAELIKNPNQLEDGTVFQVIESWLEREVHAGYQVKNLLYPAI